MLFCIVLCWYVLVCVVVFRFVSVFVCCFVPLGAALSECFVATVVVGGVL